MRELHAVQCVILIWQSIQRQAGDEAKLHRGGRVLQAVWKNTVEEETGYFCREKLGIAKVSAWVLRTIVCSRGRSGREAFVHVARARSPSRLSRGRCISIPNVWR